MNKAYFHVISKRLQSKLNSGASLLDGVFKKYLLLANTSITVLLSTTGDLMQQKYEILQSRQMVFNKSRAVKVGSTGLIIGPLCHTWYLTLDKYIKGTGLKPIAKKVVLDQLLFSPVLISVFLTLIWALDGGRNLGTLYKELKLKGTDLYLAECAIWPPAQCINFAFLPTRYRVIYDNTISLGFDYYYSYISYGKYSKRTTIGPTDAKRCKESKYILCYAFISFFFILTETLHSTKYSRLVQCIRRFDLVQT